MSDLKTLFERDPFGLNSVDGDEQRVAKFWAMRKAERQARMEAPMRREAERIAKAAAKAERARIKAEKERLKTERAAPRVAKKAAKLKPDPRQIDLEDLIDTIDKNSA